MDTDNLIRMANRIGDFFAAMPDREEALEGVATHIRKFWTPAMRQAFLGAADARPEGLHEVVRAAVERHRGLLA